MLTHICQHTDLFLVFIMELHSFLVGFPEGGVTSASMRVKFSHMPAIYGDILPVLYNNVLPVLYNNVLPVLYNNVLPVL